MKQCPSCGGKLKSNGTKPMGELLRVYRKCTACTYRDLVKVEPARVVKVLKVLSSDGQEHDFACSKNVASAKIEA